MNPTSESPQPRKPHLALLIATGFGLGKLPLAPGTWGSLGGVLLAYVALWGSEIKLLWLLNHVAPEGGGIGTKILVGRLAIDVDELAIFYWPFVLLLAGIGIWAAGRASQFLATKDPQNVVIDEVVGQMITYLPVGPRVISDGGWKYLALGFILFRAFDIWKPFPARRAERLPGGWGIMADDWVAGIYAALGLWVARAMGL